MSNIYKAHRLIAERAERTLPHDLTDWPAVAAHARWVPQWRGPRRRRVHSRGVHAVV